MPKKYMTRNTRPKKVHNRSRKRRRKKKKKIKKI